MSALPAAPPGQSLSDRIIGIYLPELGQGLALTLGLAALGLLLTVIVALTAGLMRTSGNVLVRGGSRIFVDFFRSTSLVVQLFWIYFALPAALGFQFADMLGLPAKFWAGVVALGLNYGAYASEIVRGSIQAVPKAQWEATVALNMTPAQRMRRVILPQAIPLMLPSFGNTVVELLKGTSLVSLIGLADMAWRADQKRGLYESDTPLIFGTLLLIYFAFAYLMTLGMRYLERRANASVGRPNPPSRLARALGRSKSKIAGEGAG